MQLSKQERLILHNQYLILAKLYPQQAKSYEIKAEIVSSGYTRLYARELAQFLDAEVPEDVCAEVTDILEMYRLLHAATGVQFTGFDGNEEGDHYAYACFMIEDMGRWSEFAKCELNSHAEMLPRYRKMLDVWNSRPQKPALTKAEAESIIQAGDSTISD